MLYFCSKIYVFDPQNYGARQTLPHKIMEQCRLRPARSQSLCYLPRKVTETLFFAPQNHGDIVLCPAKLWSIADFAPQNHGDIVSGAKKKSSNLIVVSFSNYFWKSSSFPRSVQPFEPLFKEKIFCVMVPLTVKELFRASCQQFLLTISGRKLKTTRHFCKGLKVLKHPQWERSGSNQQSTVSKLITAQVHSSSPWHWKAAIRRQYRQLKQWRRNKAL